MIERRLALAGATAVTVALALFGWLHVTPPTSALDWRTRTISQYALMDNGWAFNAAVLLLAAGSALVLAALIRAGVIRPVSGAAVLLSLWAAGLVGVVVFEKHNWSAGPSMSGDLHRVATVVAFLSLPAAAILAARPWLRRPATRMVAAAVILGAVVSLLSLTPILYAFASEPWTGVRWWRAIPLGGVERVLAAAEVATVLILAWWSGTRRRARVPQPAG